MIPPRTIPARPEFIQELGGQANSLKDGLVFASVGGVQKELISLASFYAISTFDTSSAEIGAGPDGVTHSWEVPNASGSGSTQDGDELTILFWWAPYNGVSAGANLSRDNGFLNPINATELVSSGDTVYYSDSLNQI